MALLAIPDVSSLIRMGTLLRAQVGEMLTGLEFFNDVGQGLALRHLAGLTHPLDTRTAWYLLAELSAGSEQVPVDLILETALTEGMEAELVSDGTLAMSEAQRAALWWLREEQPEGQRREGPQLKHDISVPPGRSGAFIEQCAALVEGILPGMRINPFGHLGGGNVHYNLSPPEAGDFGTHAPALAEALGRLTIDLGAASPPDMAWAGPTWRLPISCGTRRSSAPWSNGRSRPTTLTASPRHIPRPRPLPRCAGFWTRPGAR